LKLKAQTANIFGAESRFWNMILVAYYCLHN